MDRNIELKALADRILFGFHLSDYLHTIGKAHIIGSYKMNILAIADLNIAVENEDMNLDRLYKATDQILKTIKPVSFNGYETINKKGQKEWYFTFKKDIKGELFNVDIRFISKAKIEAIEQFCEQVSSRLNAETRLATMSIKQQLFAEGAYCGCPYNCLDVYDAVINKQIVSYNEFVKNYKK